ncbi:MAG: hypothetical protein C4327_02595 [Meiothermus sp.]
MRLPPLIYPLFSILAWGSNATALKVLVGYLPPHAMNSLRVLLASVAYAALWTLFGRERLGWRDWVVIAGLGLVGNSLYQWFFLEGVPRLPASYTSIVSSTNPVWVALLSVLWLREPLPRMAYAGLAISLGGVMILSGETLSQGRAQWLGIVFVLLSAVSWAVYTVGARRFASRYRLLTWTGGSFVVGMVPYWLLHTPDMLGITGAAVPVWVWALLVASGLLANTLAFLTWMQGVRQLGPVRVAVFSNLTPVVGVLAGVIFLGERLPVQALLGGLLTLIGIVIAQRAQRI